MLSLGKYPAVSLKEVRKRCLKAEELLHAGTEPGAQKKLEKARRKQIAENTLEAIANDSNERYLSKKAPAHQKHAWGIVRRCILPYLGKSPIADITAPDTLAVARIQEKRGTIETVKRVIQTTGQIIRHPRCPIGILAHVNKKHCLKAFNWQ